MPVSTRQPTPGPSTLAPIALHPPNHSRNSRKRSVSEPQEDMRETKKRRVAVGPETLLTPTNGKDKKKKKKKKKRRVSVVKPDSELNERLRSMGRSVTHSPGKHGAISGAKLVPSGRAADHMNGHDEDEPMLSSSDKGKGKAKSESPSRRAVISPPPQPAASSSASASTLTEVSSQDTEIALLKEQLGAQAKLLERHQSHLSQHHQSLTCQICLDLMYKPYALSPCGHITCYGCLVRWFTAPSNPAAPPPAQHGVEPAPQEPDTIDTILNSAPARNGSYIRRRKKCPVCRAVITDRPVEMWGIKDMVSALVRSALVDIPSITIPTPPNEGVNNTNTDPWRNVFRRAGSTHGDAFAAFFPHAVPAPRAEAEEDREQMGWYDQEDGGIHRCVDCYHEIWDGVCSACRRRYPGHGGHNDDEDDDEDDGSDVGDFRRFLERGGDDDSDENSEDHADIDIMEYLLDREQRLMQGDELSDDDDQEEDEEDPLPYLPAMLDLQMHHRLPQFIAGYPHHLAGNGGGWPLGRGGTHIDEVGDDEEGEDEDDGQSNYGGSFIDDGDGDDDEDEAGAVERRALHACLAARRNFVHAEDEDEEEDEDDDDEEEGDDLEPVVELDVDLHGDKDDEDPEEDGYPRATLRRLPHRRIFDESEDGSDIEDLEEDSPPIIRRYNSRPYPLVVELDEDEEDADIDQNSEDDGW